MSARHLRRLHRQCVELTQVTAAIRAIGLMAEPIFSLKVSQLKEILQVRWSVFLLGPAGCGKTSIWKTLQATQNHLGDRTEVQVINPKVC
jgi:dynein heavy chain, axonemal